MVPQKTWVSESFWTNLEILEAFLVGLEVSNFHKSQSQILKLGFCKVSNLPFLTSTSY